jgi:RND family efflux transporter MFP subunit
MATPVDKSDVRPDAAEQIVTQPPPGTGRRVWFIVILAAVVLAGGFAAARLPREREREAADALARTVRDTPPKVLVEHPRRAPAVTTLTLPGETQAFNQTTIYARVNGYIQEWLHDIGDRVKEGELLARIDAPELDQELLQARAALNARKAAVVLAEAELEFARVSLVRWEEAAPKGAVSKQELDQKRAEFKVAQAKLNAANAQVDLAEADVRRLEFWEGFKRVVAPFDGVIFQRHIDIGSLITAGSTQNTTPLYTIEKADVIRAFVKVPQKVSNLIKVGMHAKITVPELPGRVFDGYVDRTATAIERASRTLKVEALVQNPDYVLVTGMFHNAAFELISDNPPWVIRASALHVRAKGAQVALISPDGRLSYRDVRIVRDNGSTIEIDADLTADDWLALNISSELVDGDTVRPEPLAPTTQP